MLKKTLLSLAVAATTLTIAGCNLSTTDEHENKIRNEGVVSAQPSSVYPLFNPQPTDGSAPQLPLATDIIFSVNNMADGTPGKDGTAQTVDNQAPVTTAVNKLAGFSTVAPLYINFSEELDPSTVLAGKTVVLAKLATGSKPLETAANPAPVAVSSDVYEASYIELDDANGNAIPTVRILFKQPLQPKSKYLVIFTDGIKGKNGEKAGSAATYGILASNDTINGITTQQQSLRNTIQGWQRLAGAVLGGKGKSVFSYTFTTDGSLDQLKQYAAPGLFVKNNVSVAAAEALTDAAAPLTNIVARKIAVTREQGNPNDPGQLAAVTSEQIAGVKASNAYTVQLFNAIANAELSGSLTLSSAANAPKARTVQTINQTAVDSQVSSARSNTFGASPANFGLGSDIYTRYVQGTIAVPDFLGLPGLTLGATAADVVGAMRGDNNWKANDTVGALLDEALNNDPDTTPPKDSITDADDNTVELTNVTYHFPFPGEADSAAKEIKVPYLLTLPAKINYTGGADCSEVTKFKTVIFVHGITSNRVASAGYAAQLASQCIATVAIDLPVHGIAPADGDKTIFSVTTGNTERAATGSPWAGIAASSSLTMNERHGGITQTAQSVRINMDYSVIATAKAMPSSTDAEKKAQADTYASGGSSGSTFINLQNFGRTHDNLRQAVTDLLNLNASLGNIHAALDLDNVYVVGHSLGGIVASAFVAVNNDAEVQAYVGYNPNGGGLGVATGVLPKIKGLVVANSGGHITKLLENSPAFSQQIQAGLKASGVLQGSESFEKFLYVFQSIIDGIDPANTASKFGDIPVQLFTVVGSSAAGTPPDTTVPVRDYFANASTNPFANAVTPACFETPSASGCDAAGVIALPSAGAPTAKSYLAGTQAFKVVTGLSSTSGLKETTYGVANHSTFADAGTSMPTAAQATAQGNFADMVGKSVYLIKAGTATAEAK